MRIASAVFMALLVISMSSTTGFLTHPQEPIKNAFAETSLPIDDLGNYVVFGFEEVEIKKNVVVNSGNVGVNEQESEVKLDKGTIFDEPNSSLVGDTIKIEKDVIAQNVFFNELENKGDILGTQNSPLTLPVIDNFPNVPDLSPSTSSIELNKDETLTLAAGQYDEIKVDEGAILIFEGGLYSASKIEVKKDAKLLFDDLSQLVIQENLKLDKETVLGPSETSTVSATDIVIFVESDVDIDKDVTIDANIFAPNGEISMDEGAQATGAFVANKVKIAKDSTLTLDSQLGILTLIEELEDTLKELEELFPIIQEDNSQDISELVNEKIEKIRLIVLELENKGIAVEVDAVESSPLQLIIKFIEKNEGKVVKIIDGFSTACGLISTFALMEFATPLLVPPFNVLEVNALNFVNIDLCGVTGAPGAAVLDPSIRPQVFTYLTEIGKYLIGKASASDVANAFNLPAIRESWLSSAEIVDIVFGGLATDVINRMIDVISGTISGIKFNDINGDGIQQVDDGEGTISGWEIFLIDQVVGETLETQLTDSDGKYFFDRLATRTYVIAEEMRPGVEQTFPDPNGPELGTHVEEIQAAFNIQNVNFGNRQTIAELTVIKNVINNDGGTLSPSDFTIHVTGNNPIPSDFAGSGSTGTILFQDDYSSDAGWTQVSTGVTVNDPSFSDIVKFNGVPDASDRRVHKAIGTTLSDTEWILESEFFVNTHSGNPSHIPFVLTAGTGIPVVSGEDSFGLFYTDVGDPGIGLTAFANDDGVGGANAPKIIVGINEKVYLRLSRTSLTTATFEVFSDAARTIHVPGSPALITGIPSTVTGLNTIQHANGFTGGPGRNLTAEIDNTVIFGAGMDSGGTIVDLSPGAYSVTEDPEAGYTGSFSADCSGTISAGESKSCIITNDDDPALGQLTVIKNVINNDGGTLSPSDFTIHVTGNNPIPSDFAGSGSTGTILFQDDYSSDAGWTQVSTGVTVNDPSFPGIVKFNMVPDASDRRVHKSLGTTLSDTQWVLESEFLVNAHSGNPGHQVYVLSAGTGDPGQQATDQDSIGVSYNSISGDPVGFSIRSKDGTGILASHGTKIPFDAGQQVYLRLSRTAATDVTLEVFSDAARTQHIPGSPVTVTDIPATIVGLDTIQHANTSQGGPGRNLTAEIDNTVIFGAGMDSGGTIVDLSPGAYSVTEDPEAGYTGSFSADCSGTISAGESKSCIITNDDNPAPTNVVLELTRSHSGHIVDNTVDNDCADGNIISVTSAGVTFEPVFIKIRSGGVNDCNVGLREWDVSSIPDNANIISVEWIATFHQNDPNQFPPVCDVVQLDTRPSTVGDAQSLLDEIIGNPSFVDDATFCDSIGSKAINLGPSAASHLENVSLGNDWFAFAVKARPDTTQQAFHQSIYTNEQGNPTILRVVYSVP